MGPILNYFKTIEIPSNFVPFQLFLKFIVNMTTTQFQTRNNVTGTSI